MATYTGEDKRLQYLFQNGGGGGGTTVIANPSGEATDNLEKIQIGSTIYEILGGGGAGAGYKEVSLWTGSQTTTGDVALSDSVENFDYIIVRWSTHKTNTAYYNRELFILVSDINFNMPSSVYAEFADAWYLDSTHWANMSCGFKDNTTFNVAEKSAGNLSGVTILEIVGVKIEGSVIALASCYSTEERQVGCWIDGKPLYQKTFDLGSDITIAAQAWTQISSIVISDHNIDKIIAGLTQSSTKETISALNYSGNTNNTLYIFNARNAQFTIRYITLQYTKTTDTAGSGIWTPSGSYAEHYSTSEQVVGTWIDGKPIYRKSYVFNNVVTCQSQQWTSLTEAPASNISEVIRGFGQDANGTLFVPLGVNVNAGYFGVLNTRNNIITFKKFTIEYTKTT